MKFKKEIIAILLIICMLFTISAISASDNNATVVSVTNESVTAADVSADSQILEKNSDVEILGDTDDGSFAALNTKISSATAGSTVYLENDYEYKSTDSGNNGISISKSITIDGQGHKIDAKTNSRIFNINGANIDVTLKNITFINGKTTHGGALYALCNNLDIINCTFSNCEASSNPGGAIYSRVTNYFNLINSTFESNKANYAIASKGAGGAVYVFDSNSNVGTNIKNCNFLNNNAYNGGALYFSSAQLLEENVIGCTFINNQASTFSGSAIYVKYGVYNIANSIFLSNGGNNIEGTFTTINADYNWWGNTADDYNTPKYAVSSNIIVNNWLFLDITAITKNNVATLSLNNLYDGSDVSSYETDDLPPITFNFETTNVNLDENTATLSGNGKAIIDYSLTENTGTLTANYNGVSISKDLEVYLDGTFTDLNTLISGATSTTPIKLEKDYYYNSTSDTAYVEGIDINTNNIEIDGQGHTVDAKGLASVFNIYKSGITVKNINFVNGFSSRYPGVIYADHASNLNIKNCTFINNKGSSGVMYMYYVNAVIEECTFINNTGSSNGVISWFYNPGTIKNCIFINNSGNTAGSIYWSTYNGDGIISNSIFINNSGNYDLYWDNQYGSTLYADNNWWGHTIEDYSSLSPRLNSALTVNNYYVLDLNTNENGAIVSLNKLYENGVLSTKNYALPKFNLKIEGENIDVPNSIVLNDDEVLIGFNPVDEYSITVFYNGVELTKIVTPTNFMKLNEIINVGTDDVIYLENDFEYDSNKDSSLTNGIEISRQVTIDGQGHIINAKGGKNIFYFDNVGKNLVLKNIIFANATGIDGAAVYFKGNKIEVVNCTFINNTASSKGDALYIIASDNANTITQSSFINNIGSNSIIYIDFTTKVNINNSIFISNDATNNIVGSSNVVADYNWWGNTAENYDVNITKIDGVTINKWLFLKIDADAVITGTATISLNNLYDGSAVTDYADYALPATAFTLSGINATPRISTITVGNGGHATYMFAMYKTTASLTVSYEDITTIKTLEYSIVDDGSFNALNAILWFAESEVTLDKNYTFIEGVDTVTDGMIIRSPITVNGNGFTINGKGKAALLSVYANNVVLNDLILINGIADYGGAIYTEQLLKVNNCVFINNTATEYGGAIFSNANTNMGMISDSTFINNSASGPGSAIYSHAYGGEVSRCVFINNTGTHTIYDYNYGEVSHSIFINNNANYQVGGQSVPQNYNWYGNTYDNYLLTPTTGSTVSNWLYLDIQFLDDFAIISLNHLYDTSSAVSKVYSGYNLPEITLNINSTTLNLETDKVTLDNTGKAIVPYTKISDDAALTVSFEGLSLTKDCEMGDFDTLQTMVDLAVYNSVIELTRDYSYTEGIDTITNGIVISKQITIDGKGHTIDAKGLSRIFYLRDESRIVNLVLKNIKFVNGKSTHGGSLYFLGKNIDIINCTFENSTATANPGGAVYLDNYGSNIINSTFIKNVVTISGDSKTGGAVYILEKGGQNNFINSTFINNTVNIYGGAIATAGGKAINNIDKCVFITNGGSYGTAVYINGATSSVSEFYLRNSILFGTGLSDSAARVYISGSLKASDVNNNWWMNTKNNYATPYVRVSGVGLTPTKWLYLDITCENDIATISLNNVYDKNAGTASNYDGQLPQITLDLTALNAIINNNVTLNPDGTGDAEYDLTAQTGSLTATYYGVSFTKELTIDDSFTSLATKINRAEEGSTITLSHNYTYDSTKDSELTGGIEITKTLTIDGQGVTIDAADASAIFKINDDNKDIVFKNINFINANGDNGVAVNANCNSIEIVNCTFDSCKATADGIVNIIANNAHITQSVFIKNDGKVSVVNMGPVSQNPSFNIENSVFISNEGSNLHADSIDVTADYNWFGNTADNPNEDLSNNLATKWYVLNMTVDDEKSLATISLNNLFDGTAVNPYENYALPQITLNIQSTTAAAKKDKVTLDENGAATVEYIVTDASGLGTLTAEYNGIEITRNIAYNPENDYSFKALQKLIDDASANEVISLAHDYEYVMGYDDRQIEIKKPNLTIEGNGHILDGKEQTRIFHLGDGSQNILINNLTFINGKLSSNADYGAAIYWHSDYGNITNCTFINNYAFSGGAVNVNNYLSVFNCTFIDNKAQQHGGAIRVQNYNNVIIDKSAFINNDGGYYGGAIYWYSGNNGNISNSLFLNNKASNGKDIFKRQGSLDADYNWFGNNNDNNYVTPTTVSGVTLTAWLYLNANHDSMLLGKDASIEFVFKLIKSSSVSDYNNSKVHDLSLNLTAQNGELNKDSAGIGENIMFKALQKEDVSITANYYGLDYTVNLNVKEPINIIADKEITIHVGENSKIEVTWNPEVEGQLKFLLDENDGIIDVSYNTGDIQGLKEGRKNVTVQFDPIDKDTYAISSLNVSVTVIKNPASITLIDADPIHINVNDVNIQLNYTKESDADINFASNDTSVLEIDPVTGEMTGKKGGKVNITISLPQTDAYEATTKNVTVFVDKIVADVSADPFEVLVGEEKVIDVIKPVDFDGSIVYVSALPANLTVDGDGKVKGLKGGEVVVTMSWEETPKYLANSATVTVKINKLTPTITVTNTEPVSVNADASITIDASVDSGAALTYTVNDTNVASLEGNVLTGKIGGKVNVTVISAETDEYLSGSKNVTVTVNKISPQISVAPFDVDVNAEKEISVVKPGDYDGIISFVSGSPSVAGIDSDKVTGIIGGTSEITAGWSETDKYTSGSNTFTVTVNKIDAQISASPFDVDVFEEKAINVVKPDDFDGTIVYVSALPANLTVDGDGKVKGLKGGEVVVTMSWDESPKYNAGTADVTVTVNKIAPTITISNVDSVSVDADGNVVIVASVDSLGELTYKSNDTDVATVDSTGKVTGVIAGKVNITVTAAETDEYTSGSKNVSVTVNRISPDIRADAFDVDADANKQIVPIKPADYDGDIIYTGNDTGVATVEGDVIKGIIGGKVNVTISWSETAKYTAGNSNVIVTVNKISPNLHGSELDVEYNHTGSLVITHDGDGLVTYESADEDIATVDNTGKVTAVKIGQTTIRVNIAETDKYTAEYLDVTVNIVKTSPNLEAKTVRVKIGNNESIVLSRLGEGALTYEIIDTTIATVDGNANVTGIGEGTTTLKITIAETENYTAQTIEVDVVVSAKEVGRITISPEQAYAVDVDGKIKINVTANSDGTLRFIVNDTSVASLNDDELTGIIGGKVKVTLTLPETHDYTGDEEIITITVNKLTPEITTSDEAIEVDVDKNITISATATGDGAITFTSNDTAVATVDETSGLIKGLTGGKVNITVSTVETARYVAVTKNITVTVNKLESAITVNNGEPITVDVDKTVNINATTDSDGILEYISADANIATIDGEGNVTGIRGYDVVVTVSVPETERYLANSVEVRVKVNKLTPTITIENGETDNVDADKTLQINASSDSDSELTYNINDTNIASLENNVVTGIIGGKVNVTVSVAETEKYLSGSKNITVTVNKISPDITAGDLDVDVDGNNQTQISKPVDYGGEITYVSSNSSIATVDLTGKVTGVTGGNINVTIEWGETDKYTAGNYNLTVTVNKLTPQITTEKSISVDVDGRVTISYDKVTDGVVRFRSNDTSVATVFNDGSVTGITEGVVNITLITSETPRYLEGRKNITVTVNKLKPKFNNVELVSIDVFENITLNVTTDSDASEITYSISDESLADLTGTTVTGKKGGIVNVTLRTAETERYLAGEENVTVTINKITPAVVINDNKPVYVDVDDTANIVITGVDGDFIISYETTNASIATVGNNDVTGITGGAVNVTVILTDDKSGVYKDYRQNFTVVVNKLIPEITINIDEHSVDVDSSINLIASVDSEGDLSYTSNDTSVAEVDSTGTVIGIKGGFANITVIAAETDKYLSGNKSIVITVNKLDSVIEINDPIDVEYNQTITINPKVNAIYGYPVDGGNLTYFIDDTQISGIISVGDAFEYNIKRTDEFNITVRYGGSEKYLPTERNITVKSQKAINNVVVEVQNVVYPNEITIKVTADVDGTYTVVLNDTENTKLTVEVINGVGTNTTLLNAGNYSADVTSFDYENYTVNAQNATFEVEKAKINVSIFVDEIVYANNVTGYIITDVSGTYTITIDDTYSFDVDAIGGDNPNYFSQEVDLNVIDDLYRAQVNIAELPNYKKQENETYFGVIKADNNIEVIVTDTTYPFDVTVQVRATVAGIYKVNINGTVVDVEANSTGITLKLAAGTYYANVTGYSSDNYNGVYHNDSFNVIKGVAVIVVNVEDTTLPNEVFIKVVSNIPDTYNIVINDTYSVPVVIDEKGEGNATISLPAGNYAATTTFADSQNYTIIMTDAYFNVNKAVNNIKIEVGDVVCTQEIAVNVTADIDGEYTVLINNTSVKVNVVDGFGSNKTGLDEGLYVATVDYVNDTYEANVTQAKFNVLPLEKGSITIADNKYPQNATITLTVYDGVEITVDYESIKPNVDVIAEEIYFLVNGVITYVSDGKLTFKVDNTDKYEIKAIYDVTIESERYNLTSNAIAYDITVKNSKVSVEVDNITYNTDSKININVGEDGLYDVIVNNKTYEVKAENGSATLDLGILPAGDYDLEIISKADENIRNSTKFTVSKADDINPDIEVYNGELTITDAYNATGKLTISVNGTDYEVELVNGSAKTTLDLYPGEYEATVKYDGDDNYNPVTKNITLTVPKIEIPADEAISVSIVNGTTSPEITVKLPDDATGNVTVSIDGVELPVSEIINGTATINPGDLVIGSHVVEISYTGDDKYAPIVNTTSFDVSKIPTPIEDAVNIEISEGTSSPEITVKLPEFASGEVNITVDGKEHIVPINAGVATLTIENMTVGNHSIAVSYPGDYRYAAANISSTFNIPKIVLPENKTIDIEVPQNTTSPEVTVKLPNDATGNVTVTVDGKDYQAAVVNGTAHVDISDLPVGNHAVSVSYSGDDRYAPITKETTLNIPKIDIPVENIDIDVNLDVGSKAPEVTVTLPSDATGYVLVNISGYNYYVPIENGVSAISLPNLGYGEHNASVTYSGDGKYNSVIKNITVKIPKPKLYAKNIVIGYTNKYPFKVRVTIDGKAVVKQYVTFKFNGKTYKRLTNSKGYAILRLPIVNPMKTYTLKATYKDVSIYKKVKVRSIIVVKNRVVKKTAKKLTIKVKLKPVAYKILKGKTLTLKLNGKNFKAKTNKYGIATFIIKKNVLNKLKVGKTYKFKVTYAKNSVIKILKVRR